MNLICKDDSLQIMAEKGYPYRHHTTLVREAVPRSTFLSAATLASPADSKPFASGNNSFQIRNEANMVSIHQALKCPVSLAKKSETSLL